MLGDFAFQELGRQEGRLCDMSRSIWENRRTIPGVPCQPVVC